jgi:hypothetical protein
LFLLFTVLLVHRLKVRVYFNARPEDLNFEEEVALLYSSLSLSFDDVWQYLRISFSNNWILELMMVCLCLCCFHRLLKRELLNWT